MSLRQPLDRDQFDKSAVTTCCVCTYTQREPLTLRRGPQVHEHAATDGGELLLLRITPLDQLLYCSQGGGEQTRAEVHEMPSERMSPGFGYSGDLRSRAPPPPRGDAVVTHARPPHREGEEESCLIERSQSRTNLDTTQ